MARIAVVGAGMVGLTTAMLLAKDGHEVVVLERDPSGPSADPDGAWREWERRGVNQFRLPHFLLGRFRQVVDGELPEVAASLESLGALRHNPFLAIPEDIRGSAQPGDEDFEVLTARRPIAELAVARAAGATDGLEVRRGTSVVALLADGAPVPHVDGVRTDQGEDVRADLVVDCSGRRSALPALLGAAGARPPDEVLDDSGFMYFGRHFASRTGELPFAFGPNLMEHRTFTSLTLPGDNATWGVVLVTLAKDRELLGLRDPERWASVLAALPLVAHWLDGEPIDDGVVTMSKIEDRIRTFVIDDVPVATGVVAVGDAWSCSNPTHGRGISVGALHATVLRDTLRAAGTGRSSGLELAFHAATSATVRPWFEWTRHADRSRLAQIQASLEDREYEGDAQYEFEQCLGTLAGTEPDLLRAVLRAAFVLQHLDDSIDPATRARVLERGAGWRAAADLGPSRAELVKLANA